MYIRSTCMYVCAARACSKIQSTAITKQLEVAVTIAWHYTKFLLHILFIYKRTVA